jgi:hypothetical protein
MTTLDSHRTLLTSSRAIVHTDEESRYTKTITEETQGPMLIKHKDDDIMHFRNDGDDNFSKMVRLRKKPTVSSEHQDS